MREGKVASVGDQLIERLTAGRLRYLAKPLTTSLPLLGIAVWVGVLWDRMDAVDDTFYATVATVIPVFLIALALTLASWREQVVRTAATWTDGAIGAMTALAMVFLTTVALAILGEIAALAALARNAGGSSFLFVLASVPFIWLLFAFVLVEFQGYLALREWLLNHAAPALEEQPDAPPRNPAPPGVEGGSAEKVVDQFEAEDGPGDGKVNKNPTPPKVGGGSAGKIVDQFEAENGPGDEKVDKSE